MGSPHWSRIPRQVSEANTCRKTRRIGRALGMADDRNSVALSEKKLYFDQSPVKRIALG